jgi:hypothetical protein
MYQILLMTINPNAFQLMTINPNAFHRSMYVFECPSAECAKSSAGSIRVLNIEIKIEIDGNLFLFLLGVRDVHWLLRIRFIDGFLCFVLFGFVSSTSSSMSVLSTVGVGSSASASVLLTTSY